MAAKNPKWWLACTIAGQWSGCGFDAAFIFAKGHCFMDYVTSRTLKRAKETIYYRGGHLLKKNT